MKSSLPLLAALAVLPAGCSKHSCDIPEPYGNGLPGKWALVELQCYCVPGPTPNEQLVITPTDFAEYRNGSQTLDATYTTPAGPPATLCGQPSTLLAMRIAPKATPSQSTGVGYTLRNDTLVLDYGSPCDAPRKTYRRVR